MPEARALLAWDNAGLVMDSAMPELELADCGRYDRDGQFIADDLGLEGARMVAETARQYNTSMTLPNYGLKVADEHFGVQAFRHRALWAVVKTVKAREGAMEKTEANRLVVRRLLCDQMTRLGWRPHWIEVQADRGAHLYFYRTKTDRENSAFAASLEVEEAELAYRYGQMDWSWKSWLVSFIRRPQVYPGA